jgi:hypothetical protein
VRVVAVGGGGDLGRARILGSGSEGAAVLFFCPSGEIGLLPLLLAYAESSMFLFSLYVTVS